MILEASHDAAANLRTMTRIHENWRDVVLG